MKTIVGSIVILILILQGCMNEKNNFPEGAWKLVKYQVLVDGKQDHQYDDAIKKYSQIKLWSKEHWMFVGDEEMYGDGTYTLEGTDYEETIDHHRAKDFEGRKIRMSLEFRNDTLIQKFNPLDSLGNTISNIVSVEHYMRIK